ncbi:hypothetical protein EUX98_g4117 [Antrodiella citrinella]|uniref:Uncharacterized protein n=1 Tax=Antrodiella citrinella TaxID=2447956 RepID=A0A4S4MXK9_9APHY|nr:hypothetical protein EUX98_g4117 [Antrodiella citrinella]
MASNSTLPPPSEHDHVQDDAEDLDDKQIKDLLVEANTLKLEGNEHFKNQSWHEALGVYRSALGRLPKRKLPRPARLQEQEREDGKGKGKARDDEEDDEVPESSLPVLEPPVELSELERECAKARAVMNSNIGACYVKLGDHKEVVVACSEALKDDPVYVRALQRRAASNEQLGTWSGLSSAQEDYTKLLVLLPSDSPQVPQIKRALASLKPRAEAAQKRETAEMLEKLKGLGNSFLGNFGLSTNNFQFTPNGSGGYSMNFSQ